MHSPLPRSPDETRTPVLVFRAGRHRCAITVASVECVVDVVAIEPVPGAPAAVPGIINFHGSVVPVVDPRLRFGEQGSELTCTQKLIIVETPKRRVALLADGADDVQWISGDEVSAFEDFVPGACYVKGSLANEQGLVLVYDAEQLLTPSEENALDASLGGRSL